MGDDESPFFYLINSCLYLQFNNKKQIASFCDEVCCIFNQNEWWSFRCGILALSSRGKASGFFDHHKLFSPNANKLRNEFAFLFFIIKL